MARRQRCRTMLHGCDDMSIYNCDAEAISTPTEAEQVSQGCGPVLLTELELDCVTGAGSKPGMVGDGRQFSQPRQMR